MAVETATYISDLNASNPTGTDLKSEGDNHLRLLKSTVKATFPNVTGAVTPTQVQFNYLAGATGTTGTTTTNLVFSTSPTIATPTFTGLITASGGQIKFPATQSASADANTLDDYEEGTFTPVVQFGGASVGQTYGTQEGSYTKIGRQVFVRLYFKFTSKGTSVGTATISGLPFAQAGTSAFTPGSIVAHVMEAGVTQTVHAYVAGGASSISLHQGFGSVTVLNDTHFGNSSEMLIEISYHV